MTFVFIIFTWCIVFVFNNKISNYQVFDGVVFSDNLVVVMVEKKYLDLFYDNSSVFIDNKKIRFSLYKINRDILKRDDIVYSEIYLKIKLTGYKENDVVRFSVFKNKVYSYKLFEVIWR